LFSQKISQRTKRAFRAFGGLGHVGTNRESKNLRPENVYSDLRFKRRINFYCKNPSTA
jgi:hypothetical protein